MLDTENFTNLDNGVVPLVSVLRGLFQSRDMGMVQNVQHAGFGTLTDGGPTDSATRPAGSARRVLVHGAARRLGGLG